MQMQHCSSACTGTRAKVLSADQSMNADLANQVMMMQHFLQNIDQRLARMEQAPLEKISEMKAHMDLRQQMGFAALKEDLVSARSREDTRRQDLNLGEIDTLITARLQPLGAALKIIQKDISLSLHDSSPLKDGRSLAKLVSDDDAIPRLDDAVTQYLDAGKKRSTGLGTLELEKFRETLLADLKLHEESLLNGLFAEKNAKPISPGKSPRKVDSNEKMIYSISPIPSSIRPGNSALRPVALQTPTTQDESNMDVPSKPFVAEGSVAPVVVDLPNADASKNKPEQKDFIKRMKRFQKDEQEKQDAFRASKSESDAELFDIELKEETGLMSVFAIDTDPLRDPYHVEDYYKKAGWAQALARDSTFANLSLVVVFINAIWIGVEADRNPQENLYESKLVFIIAAQIFTVYFTFEWLVRFLAFEKKSDAFRDGWLKFDTFLVLTMVLDVWGLMVVLKIIDGKSTHIPTQPFRVLRLFKLTRMARLMNVFPELVTMIKGLGRSVRAIISTFILIMLMAYIWALVLHLLLKKEHAFNQRMYEQSYLDFTTLPRSMWALIMDGTLLLDNSAPLMTEMIFNDRWSIFVAGCLFTLYALVSALLILQMLIGVLCDVVARVNEEVRSGAAIALVRQELAVRIREVNEGDDDHVTKQTLHEVMVDARSVAVLDKLQINRLFLLQMQEMVFDMSPSITLKGALDLMLLCRSDNQANMEALAGGFCFIAKELTIMRKKLKEHFVKIHDELHQKLIGKTSPSPTVGA